MIEYLLSLSLLIAVVLLIRAVFRKTVSPRVTYALWLLVVIRMMVPVTLFLIFCFYNCISFFLNC